VHVAFAGSEPEALTAVATTNHPCKQIARWAGETGTEQRLKLLLVGCLDIMFTELNVH
jgi:hypothetical protein